ncbi:MAG: hypothetical protein HFH11_04435 [Dorea sp.]|jgi:hypothetical protein|nr:hypothetical protein [Dorea sp.]
MNKTNLQDMVSAENMLFESLEESSRQQSLRGNYGYVAGMCLLYGVLFAFCGYKNPNGITWPLLVCATIWIAYLL